MHLAAAVGIDVCTLFKLCIFKILLTFTQTYVVYNLIEANKNDISFHSSWNTSTNFTLVPTFQKV